MSETTEQAATAGRHIIERPRLTRLLDNASARVIVLVAPAGYGKTTLARQWLESRPNAWLQANEASADVVALVVDLAQTLATMGFGINPRLLERVRTMRDPREELRTLAQLQAQGLRSWPEGSWLAIDDYEFIAGSDFAEEYVRLLLQSSDMRLLVASRVNPIWATPRARLYGDIYAVDRGDLAMRAAETRAVLRDVSDGRVSQILSLADGWPALIGLASLTDPSAESAGDPPNTLFDYFADELFHRGSRALQGALPQLALASRITPDLAASMFGPRKGPKLLRDAEELGFFSVTASGVRLHPLLRRFLLTKLNGALRDAAGDNLIKFFLERLEWDDAFELIRQGKKASALAELCDSAYASMLSSGRTTTLDAWLRLAAQLGTSSPVFDVIRAELALRDGNLSHAERLALRVVTSPNAAKYRSRAFTIAGRSAHLDNRESDALIFFQSASKCARTDHERYEATWGCLLSAEAFEEEKELLAVLDRFLTHEPDSADDVLRAANARLIVAFTLGGIGEALEFALDALVAVDHAQDPLIRTSFLNGVSGALSLQARYAESRAAANRLIADAEQAKLDFVLPHAHVAKAVALIGMGCYGEAEQALVQAERFATEIGDVHNLLDASNVRAKLSVTVRDYHQAVNSLSRVDDADSVTTTMRAEILATRGLAQACLGHLEDAHTSLSKAESLSSFPEIRSLVACARGVLRLRQTRDTAHALGELEVAFQLSILDPIVIVCRALPELAKTVAARHKLPPPFATEHFTGGSLANSLAATARLTRRETEVLKLVSLGYTNREIARELIIAEVTAKVHVRNVIHKLQVRSRTEAAIVALGGAAR